MAATSNSKILLRIKKKEQKKQKINRCSVCGKKLKNFNKRRTTENPLSCWQCMILNNNNNADS